MNLNKVILIGRIASDIVMNESKNGVQFARFSLAITRDNFSNDKNEVTDFISIVAFRNNATFLSKFFNKGDLISVVGSLQSSQYTSKNGDIVSSVNVIIDQIKSLESRAITQARAEKNNIENNNKNIETKDKEEIINNEEDNPWELEF